jgi:hypothetical protein
MVKNVRDMVIGCDTNDQGHVIYKYASFSIQKNKVVTLDFSGVTNVTSSFVNSAFVQLIDDFGYDKVKSFVVLKGLNRQIGNLLRDRMMKLAA